MEHGARGRGLRAPKGPWVRAPSQGTSERRSSPQVSVRNFSVIAEVQTEGGVSGGAGARKLHVGGCARSQLCRRSGRNRSCSRSARSCIVARAGSALGTRRCLGVGVNRGGLRDGAGAARRAGLPVQAGFCRAPPRPARPPLAPPLHCPAPRPSSPTQRAREASSWKPPGHSHTAPPGRGTQRPLTQRHSSESSSELSSSAPGECRRQHQSQRWPRTPPLSLPLHSPRGGFPSSRGLASQKELLSLCDVGQWDPERAGGGQTSAASIHPGSRPKLPPGQPLPGRLTGAARRARAALGSPTSALATAAVVEGEGGPGQGARTHAVLSALAPAHVPPLRGTLCGGGAGVREERPPPLQPTLGGTAAPGLQAADRALESPR